jgi:hypothetical protein
VHKDGSVLVQLPSINDTVTRDIRIREQVNITLDCGPLINETLDQEISTITNLSTTWYSVIRQYDGTFTTTNSTVEDNDEIVIFGNNMRFLQIHTPLIAVTAAEQGNAGLYTCEFCFDLTLSSTLTICERSQAFINVRGDPPVIDRNFDHPDDNILGTLIGTTVCLPTPLDFIIVVCPQLGTTKPVGTASYFFNGVSINNPSINISFISESQVTAGFNDRIRIFTYPFEIDPSFEASFMCVLTNPFGVDIETTLFLQAPRVIKYTGSIIESSTPSYGPPGIPANTIYPTIGDIVNLNCVSNGGFNQFNITDPNGALIATTSFLISLMTMSGNYTCTTWNDCGQHSQNVLILIQKDPPVIDRNYKSNNPEYELVIGAVICIPLSATYPTPQFLICPQADTTRPIGISNYLFNGISVTDPSISGSFITFFDRLFIIPAFERDPAFALFEGVITCNLTNPFGFDTESSLIVQRGIKNLTSQSIGSCCFNITGDPKHTVCIILTIISHTVKAVEWVSIKHTEKCVILIIL